METLMTTAEREALAEAVDSDAAYIWQCLTGRRKASPALAHRIEIASGGKVRRWHVRSDWREIWPELAGHPDAPDEAARA